MGGVGCRRCGSANADGGRKSGSGQKRRGNAWLLRQCLVGECGRAGVGVRLGDGEHCVGALLEEWPSYALRPRRERHRVRRQGGGAHEVDRGTRKTARGEGGGGRGGEGVGTGAGGAIWAVEGGARVRAAGRGDCCSELARGGNYTATRARRRGMRPLADCRRTSGFAPLPRLPPLQRFGALPSVHYVLS